jgi:glycosyltransferase involved in cell wall biosynthesis
MSKLTFLIVTPVLNAERFIADCINCVKIAFKDFPYRHVIIDGGSTDRSADIITKNMHENLVFTVLPKSSMYEAINHGINLIEAEIFYQLNADDFVLPQTARIVNEYFTKDPDLAVVTGPCLSININTKSGKFIVPTKNHFRLDKIGANLFVSQPSSFVRYDVIKKLGGFSVQYKVSSDTELWLRLIKKNYKFTDAGICLSIDRMHGNCRRLTPTGEQELTEIREKYFNPSLLSFFKARGYFIYFFRLLKTMAYLQKILQPGMQPFGPAFYRILSVCFSTKKAGVIFDYPFLKETYSIQGRIC